MSETKKLFRLPRKFCEEMWFPALLSGEYKQGIGELLLASDDDYDDEGEHLQPSIHEDGEQYCCLGVAGVACGISKDLLVGQCFIQYIVGDFDDQTTQLYKKAAELGYPEELIEGSGKEVRDGGNYTLASRLSGMNDGGCHSFADIHAWIVENVELYDKVEVNAEKL
jgi:hypothetical protein